MSNLFDADKESKIQRLLALGWKKVPAYGRLYYEHPVSCAWFSEEEVLQKFERLLKESADGTQQVPRCPDGG